MLPNQMFNAVLSSLRTFDPLSDTLDILIISFVFYQKSTNVTLSL